MSTHPGAHRKVEGSGVHVHEINQQSDDEEIEIVSPNLLSARTFVHKKEECHARAQERWEEVSIHLMQRRMSNGGKGRKITINASGLTCVTYEGYLRQEFLENPFDLGLFETSRRTDPCDMHRRFPGTLLSDMVVEGSLQKKRLPDYRAYRGLCACACDCFSCAKCCRVARKKTYHIMDIVTNTDVYEQSACISLIAIPLPSTK